MTELKPFVKSDVHSTFPVDFERAMNGLRGALTDLLAAGGDDPRQPQELSRSYGLNKNLAWKICKIVNSTNSYEVSTQVPGSAGMRILLAAFEKRGVSRQVIDLVAEAFAGFEEMVRIHVGDRSHLELYVGAVQPEGVHSSQLEAMRRMAYQGNSAIWGVQARVGFVLRAVSPASSDPDRADVTSVGGLLGFRRLRPTASWPLLRQLILSENAEVGHEPVEHIDPDFDPSGAPLVGDFCSDPVPETRKTITGDTATYEICEGPVGITAQADLTFGTIDRNNVPVFAGAAGEESVGEHYCRVDTPVEIVQFDLLVHRDLPFEMPPRLATHSTLCTTPTFPLSQDKSCLLPGTTSVQALGDSLHSYSTPHIPRYGHLVTRTCERIGHPLEEFQGYRVTLTYPPIPSILVMHHPLGEAR